MEEGAVTGGRAPRRPRPEGSGRPEHYEDRRVVSRYHERYARGVARWKHERKLRLLRRWIAREKPRRVLEVACGPGRFYGAYASFRSVSLDRSRPMLERFRAQAPEAILVRGDAAALPFASGGFDVVFATRFLSHLRGDYRARVLNELARVSAGTVVLDGRHVYNLRFASRWLQRRLGLAHADKLRHTYREYRAELAAAGLELSAVRSIAWGLSARVLLLARKPGGSPRQGAGR